MAARRQRGRRVAPRGHAFTAGTAVLRLVPPDDQESRRRTSNPALAGRTPCPHRSGHVTAALRADITSANVAERDLPRGAHRHCGRSRGEAAKLDPRLNPTPTETPGRGGGRSVRGYDRISVGRHQAGSHATAGSFAPVRPGGPAARQLAFIWPLIASSVFRASRASTAQGRAWPAYLYKPRRAQKRSVMPPSAWCAAWAACWSEAVAWPTGQLSASGAFRQRVSRRWVPRSVRRRR